MPQGMITKALSGFYYVTSGEETLPCRARGIFRKKGISPLVGDLVEFENVGNQEGIVNTILPRKNELVRPPIANIDQALLVFSLVEPAFSPMLLDKFIVHIEKVRATPIICLNKADITSDLSDVNHYVDWYRQIGYPVFIISATDRQGIEPLYPHFVDRTTVFAGQSGVGKSSLLNALIPELQLETGTVSVKLGRGKHTTRHVELIRLSNGGMVADTPGFSQLDFEGIEANELGALFVDLAELSPDCKYRGCLHVKEPGCRVRAALDAGEVASFRYEHYVQFLEEIQDRKRRY